MKEMPIDEITPLSRAAVTAGETAVQTTAGLIPQAHGGALLPGGKRGNRGGGRQKEALRERMRDMLSATLDAMAKALSGERTSADSRSAILDDPRVAALA